MSIKMFDMKGVDCPKFVCDECGKVIKDAEDGNCVWSESDLVPEVHFLHKACDNQDNPDYRCWISLNLFLFQLSFNTKHNPIEAKKTQKMHDSLKCVY